MTLPAFLKVDTECAVTIERAFDAPRAAIWRAFTRGEELANWQSGPPGWKMEDCKISLAPGGSYRWRWRHPETGLRFGFKGVYTVVEPERRLIDIQIFDQSIGGPVSLLSAGARDMLSKPTKTISEFKEEGAGCRVVTTIRYPDAATRDMVVTQGLGQRMEAAYRRLDRLTMRFVA